MKMGNVVAITQISYNFCIMHSKKITPFFILWTQSYDLMKAVALSFMINSFFEYGATFHNWMRHIKPHHNWEFHAWWLGSHTHLLLFTSWMAILYRLLDTVEYYLCQLFRMTTLHGCRWSVKMGITAVPLLILYETRELSPFLFAFSLCLSLSLSPSLFLSPWKCSFGSKRKKMERKKKKEELEETGREKRRIKNGTEEKVISLV